MKSLYALLQHPKAPPSPLCCIANIVPSHHNTHNQVMKSLYALLQHPEGASKILRVTNPSATHLNPTANASASASASASARGRGSAGGKGGTNSNTSAFGGGGMNGGGGGGGMSGGINGGMGGGMSGGGGIDGEGASEWTVGGGSLWGVEYSTIDLLKDFSYWLDIMVYLRDNGGSKPTNNSGSGSGSGSDDDPAPNYQSNHQSNHQSNPSPVRTVAQWSRILSSHAVSNEYPCIFLGYLIYLPSLLFHLYYH